MQILKGYDSMENSYLVNDYPYGFRLRCKIRYWLEFDKKRGYRFCSQTSNPKKNDAWNKPKKSTYTKIEACMYINDEGRVDWAGLSEYSDYKESVDWKEKYYEGLSEEGKKRLDCWIEAKRIYEEKIASGKNWAVAGMETAKEMAEKGMSLFC